MHPTETTLGVLLLVENEHPWWSLILFRYPALDRRPTPKFHYAMFSQELIWSEEIYYTKIVVLNIRSEDTSLRSDVLHCVLIRLYGNIFSTWISATCLTSLEAAEHSICHGELSKNQPRDKRFRKLVIFVCWLAPNYILLLLTFGKLTRCQQWHWRMRSSHKNVIPITR